MRSELRLRPRDGFALPLALLAMIIIGAVVTGGFYMSSQEHTVSVSTEMGARALEMAEYGLDRAVGTMPARNYTAVSLGTVGTFPVTPVMNGSSQLGTYRIRVMPLGGRLYMVESEGQVERGGQFAVRRVAAFVRTTSAQLPYLSAVSVYGQFTATGNAQVSGQDADNCGTGDVAGVTAVQGSLVDQGNRERITGNPAVDSVASLSPQTMSDFGDLDINQLISMATRRYPGGTTLTQVGPRTTLDPNGILVCDPAHNLNWGDPLRPNPLPVPTPPCMGYYPVIHAQGNLTVSVGTGQGVLIVDGDLHLTGNMTFFGIVIVRGSFTTDGTGNHINGALLVHGDGELDTESTSTGNSLVQYASCRVQNAFSGLPVLPLASRSWVVDTPPLSAAGL